MNPASTTNNAADHLLADSVLFRQLSLRDRSRFVAQSYFAHRFLAELAHIMAFSMRLPPLRSLIALIVKMSPKKQMPWINASRVVAFMKNVAARLAISFVAFSGAFWNWANQQLIRYAMGIQQLASSQFSHHAISPWKMSGSPQPTGRGLVYASPKGLRIQVHGFNTTTFGGI